MIKGRQVEIFLSSGHVMTVKKILRRNAQNSACWPDFVNAARAHAKPGETLVGVDIGPFSIQLSFEAS